MQYSSLLNRSFKVQRVQRSTFNPHYHKVIWAKHFNRGTNITSPDSERLRPANYGGILGDFYIICNAPNRPKGAHSQASFD